ncbi:MAG: methyltransferase domain-containing protein [Candidatus Diapherotrites archaeon]|nr:methyltransferase domain-containing protein [Candidatus Diapherotrites archaeon]
MDFDTILPEEKKALQALARRKFSKAKEMKFPSPESAEQATPETAARYRAKRIAARVNPKVAVDLCCGIGMDAIALGREFKEVHAFEKEPEILACARHNALAYGADNITFHSADGMKAELHALKPDAVFADPSRRVHGIRVKELHQTRPSTTEIIPLLQRNKIREYAVEVSSGLSPASLPGGCEKEFISLSHEPLCITLYFGKLAGAERSLTLLPENIRMKSSGVPAKPGKNTLQQFLLEADEGIASMHLEAELTSLIPEAHPLEENWWTANTSIQSPFFKNIFEVKARVIAFSDLTAALQECGAGRVVLRMPLSPPQSRQKKTSLEQELTGNKKLHVIERNGEFIIAEAKTETIPSNYKPVWNH